MTSCQETVIIQVMENDPLQYLGATLIESIKIKEQFFIHYGKKLVHVADLIGQSLARGKKIMICGNGGSASDSIHFSGEMLGRMLVERHPLKAISLTADISTLTAIANDYGYEHIFSRQLGGLADEGDVLICISTSGNSKNILNAAITGREKKCLTIGILGRNGGKLKDVCEHNLIVEEAYNSSRCQETHIFILHSLVDLIDRFFLKT